MKYPSLRIWMLKPQSEKRKTPFIYIVHIIILPIIQYILCILTTQFSFKFIIHNLSKKVPTTEKDWIKDV